MWNTHMCSGVKWLLWHEAKDKCCGHNVSVTYEHAWYCNWFTVVYAECRKKSWVARVHLLIVVCTEHGKWPAWLRRQTAPSTLIKGGSSYLISVFIMRCQKLTCMKKLNWDYQIVTMNIGHIMWCGCVFALRVPQVIKWIPLVTNGELHFVTFLHAYLGI